MPSGERMYPENSVAVWRNIPFSNFVCRLCCRSLFSTYLTGHLCCSWFSEKGKYVTEVDDNVLVQNVPKHIINKGVKVAGALASETASPNIQNSGPEECAYPPPRYTQGCRPHPCRSRLVNSCMDHTQSNSSDIRERTYQFRIVIWFNAQCLPSALKSVWRMMRPALVPGGGSTGQLPEV